MSYNSYAKNSTFPPPSGGGGATPVTAVVESAVTLDISGPPGLFGFDFITDPGNSIELEWVLIDINGETALPTGYWVADPLGYNGNSWSQLIGAVGVGGPYQFVLRGFNVEGSYLDYTVDVTVENTP